MIDSIKMGWGLGGGQCYSFKRVNNCFRIIARAKPEYEILLLP